MRVRSDLSVRHPFLRVYLALSVTLNRAFQSQSQAEKKHDYAFIHSLHSGTAMLHRFVRKYSLLSAHFMHPIHHKYSEHDLHQPHPLCPSIQRSRSGSKDRKSAFQSNQLINLILHMQMQASAQTTLRCPDQSCRKDHRADASCTSATRYPHAKGTNANSILWVSNAFISSQPICAFVSIHPPFIRSFIQTPPNASVQKVCILRPDAQICKKGNSEEKENVLRAVDGGQFTYRIVRR